MLIGIDASRSLRLQPTGTERYSTEIIRHLLQLPAAGGHHWRLYTDQTPDGDAFPVRSAGAGHNNVEVRTLPARRVWTHRALGRETTRRPPDVLFVPSHVIPFAPIPSRLPPSVVTIHDLGYHAFPDSHTLRQRLYLTWSTRWSVAAAARVIAVSYATATDLRRHYGTPWDKVRVIHEATQIWQPPPIEAVRAAQAKYGLGRPYALYIGTIQPRKNVARMIQAYTSLLQDAHAGLGPGAGRRRRLAE